MRFLDRLTENLVVRLTQPSSESVLPEPENRFVSSREGFLVFASDRSGAFAPYRANLRSGVVTRLAEAKALTARSLSMDWHDREVWMVDDHVLKSVELTRLKSRTITEGVDEYHAGGRGNSLVIRRGDKLERWTPEGIKPVAEGASSRAVVNAAGNGCIFVRNGSTNELWYAPFSSDKPKLLASGRISSVYWRPDGLAVFFLRQVERKSYIASELREIALDGGAERVVAETTQFAAFASNSDGSVFVGASRSKAQPDILLLLRQARREMVLCEHRARNPEMVSPAFSPNSQRVYFQSDHEGKSAIYSVNVEKLVEQTEEPQS